MKVNLTKKIRHHPSQSGCNTGSNDATARYGNRNKKQRKGRYGGDSL